MEVGRGPKRGAGETRALIEELLAEDPSLSPREIAFRVGISTQAVYVHIKNIQDNHEEAAS